MKRIVILAFFLLTFIDTAYADHFQLLYQRGSETYDVSHSRVRVTQAHNQLVFDGYTDKYGRISINLSNGEYNGSVYYREQWLSVRLIIDGSREVKRVYLRN